MKHSIYKVETKTFEKDGVEKEMKSLVIQREGAQYPTKNVAMWDNHPLFATIEAGQEHELEIEEKDSKTPNPHGGFYKNRQVLNEAPKQEPRGTVNTETRLTRLEKAVFPDKIVELPPDVTDLEF